MKNKIKYGKKDILSEDDFDSKNVKVRVTTYIDLDIVESLKAEAKKKGEKYQALLNKRLRESLFSEKHVSLDDIEKRLEKIEQVLEIH